MQQTLRWQLIVALYNLNMSVNCSKCATIPLGFLKQISKFLTYTVCFPAELNLTIRSLCNDDAYRARRCSRDKDTEVLLSFKEPGRTVFAFHSVLLHHTIRSRQVVVHKKWSFPSLWRSKANCLMFSYGCSLYLSHWNAKRHVIASPKGTVSNSGGKWREGETWFQSKFC